MASDASVHLLSPAGFLANGVAAGLKASGNPDVGLLVCPGGAAAAAAFTRNLVVAAPVVVGRRHVADGRLRAVAVNSGNANACTGDRGLGDAEKTCRHVAELLGCDAADVLPGSTGIIGRHLDVPRLLAGFDACAPGLGGSPDHAARFARAIMTTDLVPKSAGATVKVGRSRVTIAGVCKGSGMIGPMLGVDPPARQATMLAYLTTDAKASPATLRKLLGSAAERTFNRLTVDNHASTNDTAVLLASGASGVTITRDHADAFAKALTEVCDQLAYQIAADGEGATKIVIVRVRNTPTQRDAELLARAVADSPLVKCALHGNDPNWGRVISMAGAAAARDGADFDPDACELKFAGTRVFRRGSPVAFDAAATSHAMKAREVEILLDCGRGRASAHVYTCDLSRDYIRINADYTT